MHLNNVVHQLSSNVLIDLGLELHILAIWLCEVFGFKHVFVNLIYVVFNLINIGKVRVMDG